MGHRVAVFGASGYAGGELVRLIDGHPDLELVYLGGHTAAGSTLGEVQPHLGGGDRPLGPLEPERAAGCDLAFLALPHGASSGPALALLDGGVKVVDLGSDFRLTDPAVYAEAYGSPHPHPDQLGAWAYGLPELFGAAVAGTDRVAAPGCYPTSAILALAPLLAEGLVGGDGIHVDSLSGTSGAGRSLKADLLFGAVDESVAAYGVVSHRHRPEIEQGLTSHAGAAATVVFTPHLVPMQRGLLSTCYAASTPGLTEAAAQECLREAYANAPFVDVVDVPPHTRWVVGSNRCLLHVRLDGRTGTVIVISAIDNLMKGAAGQAVQCANLMLGLDEAAGLPVAGWMP